MVDQRGGEAGIEPHAGRTPIAAAAIAAALIADFFEIGVHDATETGSAHSGEAASRVPNEN